MAHVHAGARMRPWCLSPIALGHGHMAQGLDDPLLPLPPAKRLMQLKL